MDNMSQTQEDFWGQPMFSTRGQISPDDPMRQKLIAELIREAQRPPAQVKYTPMQSDQEIRANAARMRKMNDFGTVLAMSGDKPLTTAAKAMQRDPDEYIRKQDAQRQVREYQQWQADHLTNRTPVLAKALSAMDGGFGGIGSGDRVVPSGRLSEHGFDAEQLRNTNRFFGKGDPGLTQQFGEWLGLKGFTGPLEKLPSWLARQGYADLANKPELERQARFWADLESSIIAPWRNDLFGATLTNNEQAAFRNLASLEPGMPWDEVQNRLNDLYEARKEGARERILLTVGNYGPGHAAYLRQVFGDSLSQGGGRRSWEQTAEDAGGSAIEGVDTTGRVTPDGGAGGSGQGGAPGRVRGKRTNIEAEVVQ